MASAPTRWRIFTVKRRPSGATGSSRSVSAKQRPPACAAPVDCNQRQQAKDEQYAGGAVGGCVVEVLHLVIERDGEGAGGAWNVAAQHQHHAELADSVGEGEDGGGDEGRLCERERDGAKDAQWGSTQCRSNLAQRRIDGAKARDQRLHRKREGVEHRAEDE